MNISEQEKVVLFENAMILDEAQSLLIDSSSGEEDASIMLPKAVKMIARALANLQNDIQISDASSEN